MIRALLIFFSIQFLLIGIEKACADGCSGAATFTVTYDPVNNCYFFTNTTNNDCGSSGICTWDFGDGVIVQTVQGASTVCHTYACNNTYTVNLQYDATNCSPNAVCNGSQQIVVNTGPTISVNYSGNTSACIGDPPFPILFDVNVSSGAFLGPYTIYYSINNVPQTPIASASGNASIIFNPITTGTYVISTTNITTTSTNICPSFNPTNYTLTVYDYPTAVLNSSFTVCQNDPSAFVTFNGSGNVPPYTFTYTLNNGPIQSISTTGNNSSVTVPVATNVPGNFVYSLVNVTGGSIPSCTNPIIGSTSVTVIPLPTATINGNVMVCVNDPSPLVTITGQGSVPPYTFNYLINGVPQTATTTGQNTSVNIPVPTQNADVFTFILTSVQSSANPTCFNTAFGTAVVSVISPPSATITGGTRVCQNAAPVAITFTGSGTPGPYKFTYSINNGSPQIVYSTGNSGVATITLPTNIAGTFICNLISAELTSAPYCLQSINLQDTVVVRPLPIAFVTPPIKVCQDDTPPVVTFTAGGGTAPYTLLYSVNNVLSAPVTTTGNSFSLNCATNLPGSYTYTLISVFDSGLPSCGINPGLSTTVDVIDLPVASITGSVTLCQNSASPQLTISCSGNTAPYLVTYSVNNAAPISINIPVNSSTISVPTATAGVLNYALIQVTGSSSPVCSQALVSNATVNINPQPLADIFVDPIRVCEDGPSPEITITGSNGIDPYVFDYIFDGINYQTSGTNGLLSISVPTDSPDTIYCLLTGVTSSSNPSCFTPLQKEVAVIIDPKPDLDFIPLPIPCELSSNINFINSSLYAIDYHWDFGDGYESNQVSPTHEYNFYGNYDIQLSGVTAFGCIDSIIKSLTVNDRFAIWTPNAFTPNGDNVNETFFPNALSASRVEFSIYNRWGELVYFSTTPNSGWDGKFKGVDAPLGVYVYVIKAYDLCDEERILRGHFSLIR